MKNRNFLPRLMRLDFKIFDGLLKKFHADTTIRCELFGHKMYSPTGDITEKSFCTRKRCEHISPAIKWNTPPKCKKPCKSQSN